MNPSTAEPDMADRPDAARGEHDPGGKVRLALQLGVRGSAMFSECGRYRYVLRRDWGDVRSPFVLWIGMNPSTAEADVDDPTIRKEMHFSRVMGCQGADRKRAAMAAVRLLENRRKAKE